MRTKFVRCNYRYQAQKECPWAEHIVKVCDGYMCFESTSDFSTWKNQK